MSGRKGGTRLAPRKTSFLPVAMVCLILLSLAAALSVFLLGPRDILNRFTGSGSDAGPPAVSQDTQASSETSQSPVSYSSPSAEPSDSLSPAPQTSSEADPHPSKETAPSPSPSAFAELSPTAVPTPSTDISPSPAASDDEDTPGEVPYDGSPRHPPPNGDIYSACALLTDLDTGRVLYVNNADTRNYPASLTKILTCVTVLDSGIGIDEPVVFTAPMLEGLEDASVAGFREGDAVTVKDLLYGLMLPSGADCANALAITSAGSAEGFAEMMNEKAAQLGMSRSHFVNPTGLHDPEQYSTVRDMTRLLSYALKNALFSDIFTTGEYIMPPTASSPEGIKVKNYILSGDLEISFGSGSIIGAKTGFTTPAGQCLASIAAADSGARFMLVTMGAGREFDFDGRYSIADALYLYAMAAEKTRE
ncbi:MAG: serine hydrolase [Oscillospiraceae bacterium]|nr:serine hydrolase [Oscillospiraceae bacterium]